LEFAILETSSKPFNRRRHLLFNYKISFHNLLRTTNRSSSWINPEQPFTQTIQVCATCNTVRWTVAALIETFDDGDSPDAHGRGGGEDCYRNWRFKVSEAEHRRIQLSPPVNF